MRVLILGASGGCGKWAARIAVERGHHVRALVREETPYDAPASVEVVRGSVLDEGALDAALKGREAVISCLGPQRVRPWNPWSRVRPPPRFAETSARLLVKAMVRARVARVVAVSAAGAGDRSVLPLFMRFLLKTSNLGPMYRDLDAMEAVYRDSVLDWLLVRPVTLISAAPCDRARVVPRFRTTSVIGRGDVAAWLVRAVAHDGPFVERTPLIGWW